MSLASALGLGNRKRQSVGSITGFKFAQAQGAKSVMHNVLRHNPLPQMLGQKRQFPMHMMRMTNQQFMRTRPSLSMRLRDSDGDGVPNWLDCRPFDRRLQKKPNRLQMERIRRNPSILYSVDEKTDFKHISEKPRNQYEKQTYNNLLGTLKRHPGILSDIEEIKPIVFIQKGSRHSIGELKRQTKSKNPDIDINDYMRKLNELKKVGVGRVPLSSVAADKGITPAAVVFDYSPLQEFESKQKIYDQFHELQHARQIKEGRDIGISPIDPERNGKLKYWNQPHEIEARRYGHMKTAEISPTPKATERFLEAKERAEFLNQKADWDKMKSYPQEAAAEKIKVQENTDTGFRDTFTDKPKGFFKGLVDAARGRE